MCHSALRADCTHRCSAMRHARCGQGEALEGGGGGGHSAGASWRSQQLIRRPCCSLPPQQPGHLPPPGTAP